MSAKKTSRIFIISCLLLFAGCDVVQHNTDAYNENNKNYKENGIDVSGGRAYRCGVPANANPHSNVTYRTRWLDEWMDEHEKQNQ